MYEHDVLIIGAGPTGLTLAIDLARRGISFRIVEAAATPFAGSRGKGIQPRTLEVFQNLGVVEPILASSELYPKFRVHIGPISVRAGTLGTFDKATESIPYPNIVMVPQSRTEEILRDRLLAVGGQVDFGKPLVSFIQHDDHVEVNLATGETVRTRYLVGCDGGRSTVRKVLGLPLQGESLEETNMIVADVEIDDLDRRNWHIWPLAKSGMMGLCPFAHTSFFQLTANAESAGGDIESAVQRATGYRVRNVIWSSIYRPAVRMVDRYRVDRVFLAGDAAHVHPPAGGQGLNTGVQDAFNLGWKLAYALRGGPHSLLDTYEEERLPIAAAVLGLSKRLHQAMSIKRGDATNQLALHYRTSSLSSGDSFDYPRTKALHPGDRMPDLRLADGSRLFEKMKGGHAVELISTGRPCILIRPDGYVAHIGNQPLTEYAGQPAIQIQN